MADEQKTSGQKKAGIQLWNWKRRFTIGGVILSILALILIGIRGFNIGFLALLIIGIVVLLIGVFMKDKWKKT
ncbi:MAG TPA: hypothetical protein VMB46_05965 [Methanomassiliicoccales archaeon]|nr:hypothetical protein [Methanomassiliicoccales archaeon]